MWLQQRELVAHAEPRMEQPAAPKGSTAAGGATLEQALLDDELPELIPIVGHESFAEAASLLKEEKGRAKLLTWFKERGCTLPQRQKAVGAVSKAVKKQEEARKEKKKVSEAPNEAIHSNADATTYVLCRSKQPVTSIPNLRDIAWAHASLRSGTLLRSGCVDFCSLRDARLLVDDLGVRSLIDLRTARERPIDGCSAWFVDVKREARACSCALALQPQVQVHHIPIDGMLGDENGSVETISGDVDIESLKALDLSTAPPQIKYTATTGLGADAAEVHEKMYKSSTYGSELTPAAAILVEHYLRLAERNAKPLADAMRAIAQSEGTALLYSSGGKDRTGIVCAMVMLVCGVPVESIASDYALSRGLKHMLYAAEVADTEERVLRRLKDDGPELSASASTMIAFIQAFTKRHGSLSAWLAEHAGFSSEDVIRLRARMMQPTDAA
ncbi:hypothetical protein AB1Y20_000583 [Prymnesium parvum]|uniref:Tyrosine specific protein phosphatases domain-containing protein n=1 Tax=Prymnesium parvum TaxID=97485 RepID=A0AB34K5S8_PRYPA